MADAKLEDLTEKTSFADDDLLYLVDPGGSPEDRYITGANLKASVAPSVDGLTDAESSSPYVGQSLVWNGSAWVNAVPITPGSSPTRIDSVDRRHRLDSAGNLITQRTFLVGIYLPKGVTVQSISFCSSSQALVSGTNQFFGLYDDESGSATGTARALLAASADDGSTAWAANTVKTLAMTTPYLVPKSGLYYAAVLVVATTPPSIVRGAASNATLMNLSPKMGGFNSGTTTSLANPATALNGGETTIAWAAVNL